MKRSQRTVVAALITAISCLPAAAQTTAAHDGKAVRSEQRANAKTGTRDAAANEAAVKALVEEFLSKVDDPAMHDRFWADDLIYTGSQGKVRSKADIMKSMNEGNTPGVRDKKADEPKATFSAEDLHARAFGDTVVVNFRLVQHAGDKTNYFRNSGTFVNRNGKWQAVSWQATKEAEEPATATK